MSVKKRGISAIITLMLILGRYSGYCNRHEGGRRAYDKVYRRTTND